MKRKKITRSLHGESPQLSPVTARVQTLETAVARLPAVPTAVIVIHSETLQALCLSRERELDEELSRLHEKAKRSLKCLPVGASAPSRLLRASIHVFLLSVHACFSPFLSSKLTRLFRGIQPAIFKTFSLSIQKQHEKNSRHHQ